jgi:CubicO group peptidase (beta-lactamase class C family)
MNISSTPLPGSLAQILQATLDTTRKQTVGVVAGLVSDEQGEWFGASGVKNLTTNAPVMASDRFQIGSITKTFVATVVLQLVDAGILKLNENLSQLLPSNLVSRIPFNDKIKLSQLLNHTSGVFNYADVLFNNATSLFNTWTPEELIGFAYDQPAYFAPGESWRYSNTNYILLGEIVEAATGKNLSQVIREGILTPLGMSNTFFATEESVPDVVNGYWDIDEDGRLNDVSFLSLSWAGASGNMISNAQDLTHFAEALFGGKLLQPATLQQMLTLVDTPNSNSFNGYGFGVARLRNVEGNVYGHNGLTLGYRANLWYSPEESLTYVDLQNTRVFTNFVVPILNTWNSISDMSTPTVSLQTLSLLLDSNDNVLAPAIVKSSEDGTSILSFILSAEGEIPEEGLVVTVNSNIAFRDNFAFLAERPFNLGGEFVGAVFNSAGEATGFKYRLTQSKAVINFRTSDNGKGNETVSFNLVADSGYKIDANAASSNVIFYDSLKTIPAPGNVPPEVSLSVSNPILNEVTGNTTTLTIKLTSPPPPEGVLVYIKGDRPARGGLLGRSLSEFDLFNAEVTGATFPAPDSTANGFFVRVTQQTATISFAAFPNDEEVEGLEEVTFSLVPVPGSKISTTGNAVTLATIDNADSQIQVHLAGSPAILVESAKTVSVHTFTLSAAPPKDGLVVSVVAPNISEFDLAGIKVEGGEIARVTPTGFDLKITAKTATIKLPVANDGKVEGLETATFTLQDAPAYQVNPSGTVATFKIVDTAAEAPVLTVSEANDIIAKAVDTNLNLSNNKVSFKSRLDFEFANSYDDGKGGTIYVDATEDVDMYKVTLKKGDRIYVDADANQFGPGRKVDPTLRIFDAAGTELAENVDGGAPDEIFAAKWEAYLDFTAPADGDYYIGISLWNNSRYNPNVPASGSGGDDGEDGTDPEGYGPGEYTLNINLNQPFVPAPTAIKPGDGKGPAISLYSVAGTYKNDFENLDFAIADQLIAETVPEGLSSAVSLVLTTNGEIPASGVEVFITANTALSNYFQVGGDKPFTRGGQFLDAVYDNTGKAIGFNFRIEQPFATIVLNPVNREVPETDGAETVTFSIIESVGYKASNISSTAITFYDTLPIRPAVLPTLEASLSVDKTELIESQETSFTITLSLNQAPPAEGIQLYVTGNAQDFLNEFSIFKAQFTGGIPVADGAVSGFYFRMFEKTATITLPVFNSADIIEGIEKFTLDLVPDNNADGYIVNPAKSSATITIKDTPDSQILPIVDTPEPAPATKELNDTLATAISTGLTSSNPKVTFDGQIEQHTTGRGANAIQIDITEDVDMYKVELKAGSQLIIDVDATEIGSKLQFAQIRVFDADGKELAKTGGNSFQAAPDEIFSVFNDPYLEFSAEKAGTYYVGISQIGNDYYDPKVAGSGSGWIFPNADILPGKYKLNLSLKEAPLNIVNGQSKDEILNGTEAKDVIYAKGGYDSLYGMGGDDVLVGGTEGDLIFAGDGNDLLLGDKGDDVLFGGANSDIFAFKKGDGADIISDFKVGEDKIGVVKGDIQVDDILFTQSSGITVAKVKSTGEILAYIQGVNVSQLGASSIVEVTSQQFTFG